MSRLLIYLTLVICIASLFSSITAQSVSGSAEGAISISPSTLITPGTTLTLKAEARVGNGSCAITSYLWTFVSRPVYERDPPIFTNAQAAQTDLNFLTIVGDYKMQVMVTDCIGLTTSFQFTVRVMDNIARVRVSIDDFGQFLHNGNATNVNGFTAGSSLVMNLDNVQPGDVFAIIGKNRPHTASGPNAAAIAATITWRGMDFNTDNVTWKCVGTDLSVTTGSTAWMKPGFADAGLPTAVSMGLNTNDTTWYAFNGKKPVQASADAHFIWYNNTFKNAPSDSSQAWCRYVFNPPDYLISGTNLVFTPGFFATTAPPTVVVDAPTLIVTPADIPTTTPTTSTTTPTTAADPTDPNAGLPIDDGIPTTIPIIPNAESGNQANTSSGSSSFPVIYVVIPIVVVAVLASIAIIVYRRRNRNKKENELTRLRGSNAV